jgi:small subunit ribosomal protein S20
MANTPQARKRARQNETRRQHNASLRSMYRTYIKKVVTGIESGKKDVAEKAYQEAVPVIDKMVSKGIMHKNKAARHKSRLSKKIKALQA